MRIHTDPVSGMYVNAISNVGGKDVFGNLYTATFGPTTISLPFQDGDPRQVGATGLTNEALLTILLSRLDHQNLRHHCDENDVALYHMGVALKALNVRSARVRNEREDPVVFS